MMAIALEEHDANRYHDALLTSTPLMGLPTRVELGVAARRRFGQGGMELIEELLSNYGLSFVVWDGEQTMIALAAMERYGKGRGKPPAALNYGDLFSYALAKARNLPLLYKGEDFARTDIRSALAGMSG